MHFLIIFHLLIMSVMLPCDMENPRSRCIYSNCHNLPVYRKWLCLCAWYLSFRSPPALTFPCRRWVSSCHRLFLRRSPPPPLHTHPTVERSSRPQSDPKNSPGVVGWLQTPAESSGVMWYKPCPPFTHTHTQGQESSQDPESLHKSAGALFSQWIHCSSGGVTVSVPACHMRSL